MSPYKHPLRNRVRSTAVFDEFVYTQDWAESFYPYYDTLQKWEGYFMTGKDGNNAAVTVDAKSFAVCWADLVVNKMDVLAEEYSKLVLQ